MIRTSSSSPLCLCGEFFKPRRPARTPAVHNKSPTLPGLDRCYSILTNQGYLRVPGQRTRCRLLFKDRYNFLHNLYTNKETRDSSWLVQRHRGDTFIWSRKPGAAKLGLEKRTKPRRSGNFARDASARKFHERGDEPARRDEDPEERRFDFVYLLRGLQFTTFYILIINSTVYYLVCVELSQSNPN